MADKETRQETPEDETERDETPGQKVRRLAEERDVLRAHIAEQMRPWSVGGEISPAAEAARRLARVEMDLADLSSRWPETGSGGPE